MTLLGPNRGRAFWFGWRNRMMDLGVIPIDADHRALCKEIVAQTSSTNGQTAPQGKPEIPK